MNAFFYCIQITCHTKYFKYICCTKYLYAKRKI